MSTNFDNHPPINFENADLISNPSQDGGQYAGIGYNNYWVYQGRRYHLYHEYSSGCENDNRTDSSCEYLGNFDNKDDLIAFLLKDNPDFPRWAANFILDALDYQGETA